MVRRERERALPRSSRHPDGGDAIAGHAVASPGLHWFSSPDQSDLHQQHHLDEYKYGGRRQCRLAGRRNVDSHKHGYRQHQWKHRHWFCQFWDLLHRRCECNKRRHDRWNHQLCQLSQRHLRLRQCQRHQLRHDLCDRRYRRFRQGHLRLRCHCDELRHYLWDCRRWRPQLWHLCQQQRCQCHELRHHIWIRRSIRHRHLR